MHSRWRCRVDLGLGFSGAIDAAVQRSDPRAHWSYAPRVVRNLCGSAAVGRTLDTVHAGEAVL